MYKYTHEQMHEAALQYKQTRSAQDMGKLYLCTQQYFNNIVNKYIYSQELAGDIIADINLRIYEHIDMFDEKKSNFSTWAYTIIKNEAFNRIKQLQKIDNFYDFTHLEDEYIDDEYDIVLTKYDVRPLIMQFVQEMGPKQSIYTETLIPALSHFGGLKKFAIENGINETTAKTRHFAGKRLFKKWILNKYNNKKVYVETRMSRSTHRVTKFD